MDFLYLKLGFRDSNFEIMERLSAQNLTLTSMGRNPTYYKMIRWNTFYSSLNMSSSFCCSRSGVTGLTKYPSAPARIASSVRGQDTCFMR